MGTLRTVLNEMTPLGAAGDVLTVNAGADGVEWAAGGGGAPTTADYLVKTANGSLSAERVVTDGTSITFDWSGAGLVVAKRAALTGDVTASADANATTIAPNAVTTSKILDAAVTFAKFQNLTAARVLGRGGAGGTGAPEELTLGTAFALAATTINFAPTASVDFLQQQALQFRIENRTSDPGSPVAGQIWLRTDL